MIMPRTKDMSPDERVAFLEECLVGLGRLLSHYKQQMDEADAKIKHQEEIIMNKQESLDKALGKDGRIDWCQACHDELRRNEELKKQIPKSRLKVKMDIDLTDGKYKVFLRKDMDSEPYILYEATRRPEAVKFCADHGFEVV